MKNATFLFFICALLAFGCKSDPHEAFAKDFCTCIKPMAELQKEAMDAQATSNQEAYMAAMEKGIKLEAEAMTCISELEKKHGKFEGEGEGAKVEAAFEKVCPEIAAMMKQPPPMDPGMMQDSMPVMPDKTGQ